MKNFFLRHRPGLIITGILLPVILVACGGGGNQASTLANNLVEAVTPSPVKNEGGITYTKQDLVGLDANGDGVEDQTAIRLSNMYSSQPDVLNAFMRSAKLDRDLLSIPDANLPKTKSEASAVIYGTPRLAASCNEGNVLGDSNFEKETLREYFSVFNTPAKRKRHDEIQDLAGFQTGPFVSCDEILTATPTTK